MTLILVLVLTLTSRRVWLVVCVTVLLTGGIVLEEAERRDLRARITAAEGDGGLLIRVTAADGSLRQDDCERIDRLHGVSTAYLVQDPDAAWSVLASGAMHLIYDWPTRWVLASQSALQRSTADHRVYPGLLGVADVIPASRIRLPEAEAFVAHRVRSAPDGGTCVVGSGWERRPQLPQLITVALPAGPVDIAAVRPNTIPEEVRRFNDGAFRRPGAVIAAFAGVIAGLATVARRRYVALMLTVGESKRRAIATVALPGAFDVGVAGALAAMLFVTMSLGDAALQIGPGSVAATLVIAFASFWFTSAVGLIAIGGYERYLRSDD